MATNWEAILKIRAFSLLLIMLSPTFAFANGFVGGNKLYKSCSSGNENAACSAYIVGAFDVASAMKVVCPPDDVTIGQVTDIVKRYLKEHPENRHYNASSIVVSVMQKTFPCKK